VGDDARQRLALLRFSGEVGTKARPTRLAFRRRLVHNLKDALASHGLAPDLEVSHDRILVELPHHASAIEDTAALRDHPLARLFGVQSISLAERRPVTSLADIVRSGEELFREAVRGRRFAVRARRVGDRSRVTTRPRDVDRELGTALLPVSAGVDLGRPEFTARLELTEHGTFFFSERIPAPGGLPLGVEGRAVALLSGGFDSAVAAWQLLRRGVALDYVFCNLGGQSHLLGVVRVAKVLADRWSYGDRPRLHAIDFTPVSEAIRAHAGTRYWQVVLKRMMLRAADGIAASNRAAAIVTGDALGQVSSQTLQNLAVVSRATELPILRPLVGSNKDEIIAAARHIGTFDLSKVVGEYCDMVPRKPATAATLEAIAESERRIDPAIIEATLASRATLDLRDLDVASLDVPDLVVDHLPEGATLIDLRPLADFRAGHHPRALHLEFAKAVAAFPRFDREQRYVLSCEFGLLSAHLAELMRREGFRVHHFRGGQRALMRTL
jgi:thiamine biosynthesis protein ThiI